jgi:hypothetical protein
MVLMDFNVPTVQAQAALLGFDAISTYALPGGTNEVYSHTYLSQFQLSLINLGNSIR